MHKLLPLSITSYLKCLSAFTCCRLFWPILPHDALFPQVNCDPFFNLKLQFNGILYPGILEACDEGDPSKEDMICFLTGITTHSGPH